MEFHKVTIRDVSQDFTDIFDDKTTMYKELKFDKNNHCSEMTAKCANFWRYIYSRPDLQAVRSTIFTSNCRACISGPSDSPNCHCLTPQNCRKFQRRWFATLMMMHSHGCDEAALGGTYECRLCEQQTRIPGVLADEDPNLKKMQRQEVQDLNKWEPDPNGPGTNVYDTGVICLCHKKAKI